MEKSTIELRCILSVLLAVAHRIVLADIPVLKRIFPRLMGMNIGTKNYYDMKYQRYCKVGCCNYKFSPRMELLGYKGTN